MKSDLAHGYLSMLLGRCSLSQGANTESISRLKKEAPINLPEDYIEFLGYADGVEGFVGSGAYIKLWATENVISLNEAYAVTEFLPGTMLIGTNGADVGYGITANGKFVETPLVGMSTDSVRVIGASFCDFLEHIAF